MSLVKDLHALARKSRSSDLGRFYKTGPGEYGEGDRFIGVIVPDTRLIAKKYIDLPFAAKFEKLEGVRVNKKTIAVPNDWEVDIKLLQSMTAARMKEIK
jgi:hypothetical protein